MKVVVPALQFPPALPVNLPNVLEMQARCLIANDVHRKVGISKAKFLDDALALACRFTYSVGLDDIGLNKVCLIHYGVPDRYLCKIGGIKMHIDPDKFTLYPGVTLPEGFCIVQGQFGAKYKNHRPSDIRAAHDQLEQLGVTKEGLTAFLYWGKPLLQGSCMEFPDVVAGGNYVPYLDLNNGTPELDHTGSPDRGFPFFGSVTVSRVH